MAESSIKSTTEYMNQNDFYLAFTLAAKVVIYRSIYASDLAGFSGHVQKISRVLNRFKVWVSYEAACDIFDQFFSLIFQNEIQPSARFTKCQI